MRAPAFWDAAGGRFWPVMLAPAASVYAAVTARRMARPGWRAPVPVICCGNATAGGAGKTTLALDLGQRLAARGIGVQFLLRGYGGRLTGPVRVDPDRHDAAAVGDEALLLGAARPTWVAADRAAGARAAIAAGAQALVLDDGLQHPTLAKDLSLLVIDGMAGFGNGRVIPAGPLREPPAAAARRAHAAVLIGADATGALAALPPELPVLRADLVAGPEMAALRGEAVYAFCGIANPAKFFATLQAAGANLVGRMGFADHYPYDAADLAALLADAAALRATPVTTLKDAVRLPPAYRARVTVATVGLAWAEPALLEALLDPLAARVPMPA